VDSGLASADFGQLSDQYRQELLAHCYRMLGSIQDAEDQVQETLVRAWRSFGEFEGRSSLRTWLYRIATNACLRALETRARRALPSGLGAPGENPEEPPGRWRTELPWLEPFPDSLLPPAPPAPADPAVIVGSRQSMRLALIAALQYLPPRQRAVLILRDVLGWHAAEVADLLGVSVAAVNSLLQRAREQLRDTAPGEEEIREPTEPARRALLDQYSAAFASSDVAALLRLLRADAVLEMPPLPVWFAGRDQVARFLGTHVLLRPGDFALLPTAANGQPAFASYQRDADGLHRAHGVQVLTLSEAGVARIVSFNDPALVTVFGQPELLPAAAG
jgi:RNA polymerase sigma-70 factor (ECF subfamily)